MIWNTRLFQLQFDDRLNLLSLGFPGEQRQSVRPMPPFFCNVAGHHDGSSASMTSALSLFASELEPDGFEQRGDLLILRYLHPTLRLSVKAELFRLPCGAVAQTVTAENRSDRPVTLTELSSCLVKEMGQDTRFGLECAEQGVLHWFENAWEAEFQKRECTLGQAGLTAASTHQLARSFRLLSQGSYTTARWMPLLACEFPEQDRIFFCTLEADGSWMAECGCDRLYEGAGGGYYLTLSGLHHRALGTFVSLEPGESYTAPTALFGLCRGGFEEAVSVLTSARRERYGGRPMPLMFNDYMNCLWGQPTREKLLPLIEAAAAAGCEGFCIDAGWYVTKGVSWGRNLGDWIPSADSFGREGLKGILDTIAAHGMRPGVWFELEVCGEDALAYRNPDEWFLTRFGKRVGGNERCFFNLTNPEVRAYLKSRVQALYELGVRYIKNDYNDCIGSSCDLDGGRSAGLETHHRAAMAFYDDLKASFPDLLLENCGSGAMRCDFGTLRHFDLQSTSDQELYYFYPSIAMGALANIPPERAGIWAYPFPHLFDQRGEESALTAPDYAHADPRETVFNLVTGLCGTLYLSGRIDRANARSAALIKEACALYKSSRAFLASAIPVYPLGFHSYRDQSGFAALGLISPDRRRLRLAVWRLGGQQDTVEIALDRYLLSASSALEQGVAPPDLRVRAAFPERPDGCSFALTAALLRVTLPQARSAVLLDVTAE